MFTEVPSFPRVGKTLPVTSSPSVPSLFSPFLLPLFAPVAHSQGLFRSMKGMMGNAFAPNIVAKKSRKAWNSKTNSLIDFNFKYFYGFSFKNQSGRGGFVYKIKVFNSFFTTLYLVPVGTFRS